MKLIILWLIPLVIILLGAAIFAGTPWRYCRKCGCYWHARRKASKFGKTMPRDCDGVVKVQNCRLCLK